MVNLNDLADSLLEEALTTGKMTLQNGLIYSLGTTQLLRILAFIKQGKPVASRPSKRSVLPDDLNLDIFSGLVNPPDSENDDE